MVVMRLGRNFDQLTGSGDQVTLFDVTGAYDLWSGNDPYSDVNFSFSFQKDTPTTLDGVTYSDCFRITAADKFDPTSVQYGKLLGNNLEYDASSNRLTSGTIRAVSMYDYSFIDYSYSVTGIRFPVSVFSELAEMPEGEEDGTNPDVIALVELVFNGADAIYLSALGDYVRGYGGNDTLRGYAGNDSLYGDTGADSMIGGLGHDAAYGGDGSDAIEGESGNDYLNGGNGHDTLIGGAGDDILIGRSGTDTASYADQASAIAADLSLYVTQNTQGAGNDYFYDVENLTGGSGNDTLGGNGGANLINGGAGSDVINSAAGKDTLDGGEGYDLLDGGDGSDTATYVSAVAGVTVNLSFVLAQNTLGAGVDKLSNIENLTGSAFADVLTGSATANRIDGGAGNDTAFGGAGDDTLLGGENGAGGDTVSYASAAGAVSVSLAMGWAQATGGAGTDTVLLFENLIGSSFADNLTGNAGQNVLAGGNGSDTLTGGAGTDQMKGGAGADSFVFNASSETAATSARDVIFDFVSGDKINLSGIDANSSIAGNQAFTFVGASAFSGLGQLHYKNIGGVWVVEGNRSGTVAADFSIEIRNGFTLHGDDFIL